MSKEEKEIDVKDSIIKKLKQENDSLKEQIVVLTQQLFGSKKEPVTPNPTIVDDDYISPRGRGVSVFLNNQGGENQNIGDIPLEMKYNVLTSENSKLKADLTKALESLQNQQNEMETIKEETVQLIGVEVTDEEDENKSNPDDESASNLNPFYMERIDEMYHQNKVNSRLINEIFWQLQQIHENTQSLRKILEKRSPAESVVEKTVCGSLQQEKVANEDSLVDLLMGNVKDEDQERCDVATNCFTFCGCEVEAVERNNRCDAETRVSIPRGFSSFRSTEIKEVI